jgi:exonuclease III
MTPPALRISAWNANGLTNHIQEIILYLNINKIDILLISDTQATDRTYVKIPYYTVYFANHPDNQAHAGAAIIIRTALQHYILQPYITTKIQSATVKIQLSHRPVTIAAIYSPPRHSISSEEYEEYLFTPSALVRVNEELLERKVADPV